MQQGLQMGQCHFTRCRAPYALITRLELGVAGLSLMGPHLSIRRGLANANRVGLGSAYLLPFLLIQLF
jgi:hypothetical protein